jgi:HEAT repeat protein
MMNLAIFLLGLTHAGVSEDLERAADASVPQAERMEIFERLAAGASSNHEEIVQLATNEKISSSTRWVAVQVLGKSGLSKSVDSIESLVADKDSVIRVAAISALAEMNSVGSTELIAERLTDPAMIVRGAAADALGALKDIRSIDDLEKALSSQDNYYRGQSVWVRVRFALALGKIGNNLGIPALERALNDKDPKVVEASLMALKQIVGYDFSDGRNREEHIQAWQRWIPANR